MAISSTIILPLLILQCLVLVSTARSYTTNITRDQSALLQVKSKLIDPQGFLEDWTPNRFVCQWSGVKCGVKHHRVTALNLFNMSLGGTISPEFGNLSFLVYVDMKNNFLTGTLPKELANLPRLKFLYLDSNKFSGRVPLWLGAKLEHLSLPFNNFTGSLPPSLFNLTNLQLFHIGNNSLQGEIPIQIGNLDKLTTLVIQNNQLSGTIPKTIYNISSLEVLSLANNKLSGNIPPDLCHYASRLQELYLGGNQFVGRIPTSLHECSQLTLLSLPFNKLMGSIPNSIGNATMLQILALQSNNLSGEVPDEIGNLQQLEKLILSINSFSGVFPSSISNCSMLKIFHIYNNMFIGSNSNSHHGGSATNELSIITFLTRCRQLEEIEFADNHLQGFLPRSIGNFSASLQQFRAEDCEINGIIPDEIGNVSSLILLALGANRLSGFIPRTIRGLGNLQQLYFYENQISGPIPVSICDLRSLNQIYLDTNRLTGEVPACLGILRSLQEVSLYENSLDSSIPSSLWNLKELLYLDLSSNRLNGSLPKEVGNLEQLYYMDLSANKVSGEVPSSFENLKFLQELHLQENELEGSIPESLSKMISLETLDLSNNRLSGMIPHSLTKLSKLVHFNVSFNRLVGNIPNDGPFLTFNASSFESNAALCGSSQYHVPSCFENSSEGSKKWWMFVVIGSTTILVVLALAILMQKYKRKKQPLVFERNSFSGIRRISYYELLQATENFSASNLLGMGSFGSVYKGVLNDGTVVAIKVFDLQVQGAFQSFDAECEVLRNLRHRNLTKVITSCSNNVDFKALVLEYMPNGSLEKWLHLGNYHLDMARRLNIMVDVAQALEYLHYGFSSTIVHCDIKPSNVLLDDDIVARLSDFGLTRFLNEESFTHTNRLATLGYIAPEYGAEGLISRACDVYSFGILLMEAFTKRKPSDEMFTGDLSLKSWVHSYYLKEQLVQVLDSDLLSQDARRFEKEMQSLSSIMKLALNCCVDSPKDRMNINNVRVALEKIKLQYDTSSVQEGI